MRTTIALLLALGMAGPALAQQAPDEHGHQQHQGNGNGDHDRGGDRDHGGHDHGGEHDHGGPGGGARTDQRGPGQAAPSAQGGWNRGPDRGEAQRDGNRGPGAPGGGNWDRRPDQRGNWPDRGPDRGGDARYRNGRPDGWNGGPQARDWRGGPPPGAWHGGPPPGAWNRGGPGGWDRGWRNDPRFDWGRYREYNRERFRGRPYYAPRGYGYGYRPWTAGIRIEPFFYARNYWLPDPWDYHLPPPPAGCQWVRYYNDIALVNVYNGMVLDVIPGFFY